MSYHFGHMIDSPVTEPSADCAALRDSYIAAARRYRARVHKSQDADARRLDEHSARLSARCAAHWHGKWRRALVEEARAAEWRYRRATWCAKASERHLPAGERRGAYQAVRR